MSENSIRNIPRQSRSQQTVDLILDAAGDLFASVGYEAATTNAIAEKAGISIGSLYRYYPDKDAILKELAERYYREQRELFEKVFVPDARYLPPAIMLDRRHGSRQFGIGRRHAVPPRSVRRDRSRRHGRQGAKSPQRPLKA